MITTSSNTKFIKSSIDVQNKEQFQKKLFKNFLVEIRKYTSWVKKYIKYIHRKDAKNYKQVYRKVSHITI